MMSLTERISLLNKSNSDSSNKENIEDYAMNRSIDIFDGSLGDQSSKRNSSIRKLKHQFEQQLREQQQEKERSVTQRMSMARQYSYEKKLVKSQIELIAKPREVNIPPPVAKAESQKAVDNNKTTATAIPTKLQRFFVGSSRSSEQEKKLSNEEKRDCPQMIVMGKRVQSRATTSCDFESIYKGTERAFIGHRRDSKDSTFNQIFSRLTAADLSNADEKFERLFRTISQDNLGMTFDFSFPL